MRRSAVNNFATRASGRDGRGRGFTFVELVMGMAVTIMALGAMAGVMTAVSAGWKQQGKTQGRFLSDRQTVVRVQNLLRGAKLIGLVKEGSLSSGTSDAAAVMFWKGDTSGGSADRKIQLSEVGVLVHDRSAKELKYYAVKWPATMTQAQIDAADVGVSYADLTSATWMDGFRGLTQMVSGVTVAKNVTGAAFYANCTTGQTSQFPTFEFQLAFTRDGTTANVFGTATLRNPDYSVAN